MRRATDRGGVVGADTSVRRVLFALILLLLTAPPAAAAPDNVPPGFSVLRTKYYRIHTDLDRELAEDVARRMDGMYEEYQSRLKAFVKEKSAPQLEVYLFR